MMGKELVEDGDRTSSCECSRANPPVEFMARGKIAEYTQSCRSYGLQLLEGRLELSVMRKFHEGLTVMDDLVAQTGNSAYPDSLFDESGIEIGVKMAMNDIPYTPD
jgi:hypothetical protein